MLWFWISLVAFFFLALAAVFDKFLLTKTPLKAISFAFFVSLGGAVLSLVVLFANVNLQLLPAFWLSLLIGGGALFFSLYFMFLAVEKGEVSKVNPLIVSLTPAFVFLMSFFTGLELVTGKRLLGVLLIVLAGYFLARAGAKKTRLHYQAWIFVLLSALFFGLANVFSKIVYDGLPFLEAFLGLRWTCLITAIIVVIVLNKYRDIKEIFKPTKSATQATVKKAVIIMIIGQTAGVLGVVLQQYAIKLGNVILVTALNGTQFFFLLLLVLVLAKFFPRILQEDVSRKSMLKKLLWSAILFIGVALVII